MHKMPHGVSGHWNSVGCPQFERLGGRMLYLRRRDALWVMLPPSACFCKALWIDERRLP